MKRNTRSLVRAAFVVAAAIPLVSAASSGVTISVVVTVAKDQPPTEQIQRSLDSLIPGGRAEVRYQVRGDAIRAEIGSDLFGFAQGAVRLLKAGDQTEYVLNPATKTFRKLSPNAWASDSDRPTIQIRTLPGRRTILGYMTHGIVVTYQQRIRRADLPAPDQAPQDVSVVTENWCTDELVVPSRLVGLIDTASRQAQLAGQSVGEHCPLPMLSRSRMSVLPGVEIVSTVTSVDGRAPIADSQFEIPSDYKEKRLPSPRAGSAQVGLTIK